LKKKLSDYAYELRNTSSRTVRAKRTDLYDTVGCILHIITAVI